MVQRFGFPGNVVNGTTPEGDPCALCGKRFEEGDQGFLIPMAHEPNGFSAYHRDCFIRAVGLMPSAAPGPPVPE
jgi:hypothetical protein